MLSIVQHISSARWVIAVQDHTTELKSSTTQRSIKLNFAHHILIKLNPVIMGTCALLPTQKMRSLWIFWINLRKTLTSICSISKLCGVHILIQTIQEMLVFMLIIGKISEGSLMYLIMKKNSALNGKPRISYKLMLMDANTNIDVSFLMDGKNKNIILSIIKCTHADKLNSVKNRIAHTITLNRIGDNQSISSLRYFQKIEVQWYNKLRFINRYF